MRRMQTTAIMLATMLAPCSAFAAETNLGPLVLKLNGQVSVIGAVVDQSNMVGLDQAVLAFDSGLFGSASLPIDGVGEIGMRATLDVDYATNFDSLLNDAGTSNLLREL